MAGIDWLIVGAYVVVTIAIGVALARRGGKDSASFFLSGRSLPWWLAGTSFVATTFSSDTPLMITESVRRQGIWGNWIWWGFGISHALAAVLFARWWRRSGVLTEVELTETRYSGRGAAVLRGVKAVYWGLLFNAIVMGALPLTGMRVILGVTTGWDVWMCLGVCAATVLAYGIVSGLWGVVVTDLFQFALAMAGAVALGFFAVRAAGGWEATLAAAGPERLHLIPPPSGGFWDGPFAIVASILVVQWWAFKNSDGGPIFAQRAMACRDERHAAYATVWFLIAHYALRVWPWVAAALATLVLLPGANDTEAYPRLVMQVLPAGFRGLVMASFLAAFMSTVDTYMNWGASYVVNDLYKRFVKPRATEKDCVRWGRIATVAVLGLAMTVALWSESISGGFKLILNLTAGVGPVLLARWFWWRTNAWSEIAAMAGSLATFLTVKPVAALFGVPPEPVFSLLWITAGSTALWIAVTLATPTVDPERLRAFYRAVRPFRFGWGPVARACPETAPEPMARAAGLWIAATLMTFGFTLGIGWILVGPAWVGWVSVGVGAGSLAVLLRGMRASAPSLLDPAVGRREAVEEAAGAAR